MTDKQRSKNKTTDNVCPNCGTISRDEKPAVYTCPQCGAEGYDCCVAGNGVICFQCEEGGNEDDD